MTHYTRERSDQDWYRGLRVPHTVIRNIDEKTKKAVSGTGGTYAPSTSITIGGAGLELQCSMQLSGSPGAQAKPAAGKVFRFGAADYFKNEASVLRTLVDSPLLMGLGHQAMQREARPWFESTGTNPPCIRTRRKRALVRMPLRLPDGAILSSVEIGFKVGVAHANAPVILPRARVVRITVDGVIEPYPHWLSSFTDPEGWVVLATPVSGAAYYNGGAGQTLTLTFDTTQGDVVDTSTYGYAVEWKEESGGSTSFADASGNYIVYLKSSFYQNDLRPY